MAVIAVVSGEGLGLEEPLPREFSDMATRWKSRFLFMGVFAQGSHLTIPKTKQMATPRAG